MSFLKRMILMSTVNIEEISDIVENPQDDEEVVFVLEGVSDYFLEVADDLYSVGLLTEEDVEQINSLEDASTALEYLIETIQEYVDSPEKQERKEVFKNYLETLKEISSKELDADEYAEEVVNIPEVPEIQKLSAVSQHKLDEIERQKNSLSNLLGNLSYSEATAITAVINMLDNWISDQRGQLAKDIAYEMNKPYDPYKNDYRGWL